MVLFKYLWLILEICNNHQCALIFIIIKEETIKETIPKEKCMFMTALETIITKNYKLILYTEYELSILTNVIKRNPNTHL